MNLGTHAGFIIAGYLLSFATVVGAIWLSLAQMSKVKARLAELEARGVRRRPDEAEQPVKAANQAPRPGTQA